MRFSSSANEAAVLSAFLFPLLAGAYDCNHIRINEVPFDLSKLSGARSVIHSVDRGASYLNATYTLDICRPLGKAKSVPSKDQCPNGTRLCAIERGINKETGVDSIEEVFPVAGELGDHGGKAMDAKWERLKDSTSNADSEKEGLRVEMNGGFKKDDEGKKRPQKAIIEFICDRTKDGLENLPSPEDQYDDVKDKREEKEGEKEGEDDSKSPSLSFFKWDHGSDSDILRLEWRTKYACEESKEEQDKEKAKGWGWFTWFIIIAFLSTAAYLIFGSWLNYNKYGARGWDLLPHSDTIRDIPYLMKDWIRRVLNTVQGGGSRGGYAAV